MFAHRAFSCLPLILLTALVSGCSNDDPTPSEPEDDDPSIVSATGTILPEGGEVTLPDGTSVVFPSGAVSAPLEVTIEKLEPSVWFEGSGLQERAVVRTTAELTEFASNVEIRVPLPDGMTVADSAAVLSGLIDEDTGAVQIEPSSIRMIEGRPFLVVESNHFSSRLCEWIFGQDPPSSALLAVPYFSQGSTPFCWAVTVQTVTQAASFGDLRSTMEIVGQVGVDERGISAIGYRLNSEIANIVKTRTGVKPDRMMWDIINRNQLRDYLWREVGVHRRPVGIFSSRWEHAVTVVGYDGSTFKVHNPNSVTTRAIGYTAKPWTEFVEGMAHNDKLVTLVVPKAPSTPGDRVTASWQNQAFDFTKPRYGPDEPSAIWRYFWDYREEQGYSIRHTSTEAGEGPLPGEVAFLRVNGDLQLANSSRTTATEVGIFVDVTALDAPAGMGRHSTYQTVTVEPNSIYNLHVPDFEVDNFRYNIEEEVEYALSAIVRSDGETVDWQTVKFKLAPVYAEITSVSPVAAAVGDEVTIRGKKLGWLALNNRVLFNGREAGTVASWSDDEVIVVVPEGATSGPLVLERGTVRSNAIEFTVSESSTLTGTVDASYGNELIDGVTISVSGTWKLRAPDAQLDYYIPETRHHSWYVRNQAPAVLDLSFGGTITPSDLPTEDGGRIELLPLEWDFSTSASGSSFPWSESGSDGVRSWSFTLQSYSDMFCSNPYFEVYGDVYDEEGNLTQSHVYLNGRTVGVFCAKPQ